MCVRLSRSKYHGRIQALVEKAEDQMDSILPRLTEQNCGDDCEDDPGELKLAEQLLVRVLGDLEPSHGRPRCVDAVWIKRIYFPSILHYTSLRVQELVSIRYYPRRSRFFAFRARAGGRRRVWWRRAKVEAQPPPRRFRCERRLGSWWDTWPSCTRTGTRRKWWTGTGTGGG